jgi:hypothetical protein
MLQLRRFLLDVTCITCVAALVPFASSAFADDIPMISLKSGESVRLRALAWSDRNCGNLLESVTGVDIMEAPADLKLRVEPSKVVVARPGCTQELDGAILYAETGQVEKKLSGPLVVRARMQSKTGPVQATYRFNLILYPGKTDNKK